MTQSPLLISLLWISRHHGVDAIAQTVLNGLPAQADTFSAKHLEHAAHNAGLALFRKSINEAILKKQPLDELCPVPCLPCLAWHGECPIVIVSIDKYRVKFRLPEQNMALQSLNLDVFIQRLNNELIFFSRANITDDRDPQYRPHWQNHWFWGAILQGRRIYREILLVSLLVNFFALTIPLFVRLIYDQVVPGMALNTLSTLTFGVVIVITFELVCRQLRTRFIDLAAKKTDLLMSSQLFAKIMGVRLSSISPAVGAFARKIQDFESIRDFMTSTTLTALVDLPFAMLFLLVIGLMGGSLIWIPLLVVITMLVISLAVQPRLRLSIEESERLASRKHSDLIETITGLESLRLAGAQSRFQQRWEQAIGHMASWGLKTRSITGSVTAVAVWLQQLTTVGIVYFGVIAIHAERMNMGALIAIMMLSGRAIAPFMQLALLGTKYHQALTAFRMIDQLMQSPNEQATNACYRTLDSIKGDIDLKRVSFVYPNRVMPVLEDLTLSIKQGEKVAIVGRSGSGKSTFARLLASLYLPTQGHIILDSIPITDIHPNTLRSKVGFLPQDPWLFHGSIIENITMGATGFSSEQVLNVARSCGVTLFTGDSVTALQCPTGEGGRQLSGGQRRSVALARAMLMEPDVLVLDEPTAHMDSLMDAQVQETLKNLPSNKTLIVITHRRSLMSVVSRMVMLDGGKVVSDQPVTLVESHT